MVPPADVGTTSVREASTLEERDRRPRPPVWGSGWVPAGLVTAMVLVLWLVSGVSVRDVAAFSAYVGLALVVPGTLIWRRVWGERPRPFALDVMAGLVIGYTIELPAYLLAHALGVPLLTPLWSLAVISVALAVPSQRGLWRARGCVPMPAAWSWSMAAIVTLTLLWFAHNFWWPYPISISDLSRSYSDEQLSLAIIGELRHHLPPQIPWVAGESLRYHWFIYGHVAASSWVTGIEPSVLMRRLTLVPMVVAPIVGAAVTAQHVARRTWVGPVCAALLVAVGPINVAWTTLALPYGQLFTDYGLSYSPTATYGTAVFSLVLLMSLRVLAPDEPPVARSFWIVLAAALGLLSGAKPTFLPMLIVGLAAVVAVQLVARHHARRMALGFLALLIAWLVFARLVIFRGAGGGLGLKPFDAGDHVLRALKPHGVGNPQLTAALIVGSIMLALLVKVLASLALLARGGWADPRVVLLLATSAAGWGAYALLGHTGLSQAAFARATVLPLCVAAVWGLSRLVPPVPTRQTLVVAATALGLGAILTAAMWAWWLSPVGAHPHWRLLVVPQVMVVVVVSAVVVLIGLLVPLVRRSPRLLALSVCVALIGSGTLFAVQTVQSVAKNWHAPHSIRRVVIGPGGIEAARWVRGHSSPHDLLATNEHRAEDTRSNRAFWLAAQAERRVLVEGWGYTERINSTYDSPTTEVRNLRAPFWDADKLHTNDAVFVTPSRAAVRRLAHRYGVRWLVLNRQLPSRPGRLSKLADLRFTSGDYKVYEVPTTASGSE